MELSEISVEFFFSFVFFFLFVYLRCHLLRFLFFFAFIQVFIIIIILPLLLLLLLPFVLLHVHLIVIVFFSIFVDSFLADVNECTSSTPVCGIHFNCINTLGSYRCEYNYRGESCQGKKSMNYLFFIFLIGQLNSFEAR